MHDEVEAIELGHIIAHDIAEYEAFEMTAHGISRQLFFHGFIILGFPCIDADIGCIAFIAAAAMGDFWMAVYNPSSKGRPDYLARAVRILLQNGKAPDTVCGLVRNIGREGQSAQVLTLAQLEQTPVDMFTTVYIGNRNTRVLQGRMVTPRGYRV